MCVFFNTMYPRHGQGKGEGGGGLGGHKGCGGHCLSDLRQLVSQFLNAYVLNLALKFFQPSQNILQVDEKYMILQCKG